MRMQGRQIARIIMPISRGYEVEKQNWQTWLNSATVVEHISSITTHHVKGVNCFRLKLARRTWKPRVHSNASLVSSGIQIATFWFFFPRDNQSARTQDIKTPLPQMCRVCTRNSLTGKSIHTRALIRAGVEPPGCADLWPGLRQN